MFDQNNKKNFSCKFIPILVLKSLAPDPDWISANLNSGSGSGINESGSTTLLKLHAVNNNRNRIPYQIICLVLLRRNIISHMNLKGKNRKISDRAKLSLYPEQYFNY
jgi:hypothetical protein